MNKEKLPLKNKTNFEVICIFLATGLNSMFFILSVISTIALIINRNWDFLYSVLGIILFGINTKSLFALMDYPTD